MNKLEQAIDKLIEMQFGLESCWGSLSGDGWDDVALELIKDCKTLIKNLQEFQEENDLEFKKQAIRYEL